MRLLMLLKTGGKRRRKTMRTLFELSRLLKMASVPNMMSLRYAYWQPIIYADDISQFVLMVCMAKESWRVGTKRSTK